MPVVPDKEWLHHRIQVQAMHILAILTVPDIIIVLADRVSYYSVSNAQCFGDESRASITKAKSDAWFLAIVDRAALLLKHFSILSLLAVADLGPIKLRLDQRQCWDHYLNYKLFVVS